MKIPKKNSIEHILVVTGILVVLMMLIAVWSIPLASGDLFTALAAGRDVLAGELNSPDSWSFTTGGEVWINQNWGSGTILYLVEQLAGGTGLLILKFLLLGSSLFFLILALRQRRIPLILAFPLAAAVIGGLNVYTLLRPNLFTLLCLNLELWLLGRTLRRPRQVWWIVPLLWLWANLHGGFLFGLGVLVLWSCCFLVPALLSGPRAALQKFWHLPAALVAALLLAGLANPFGLINLTLPLQMARGGVWNTVRDWLPVWQTGELSFFLSGITAFFIASGLTLLLSAVRLGFLLRPASGQALETEPADREERWLILFDVCLSVIVVLMAIFSNRFIALALPVVALLLARQLHWLAGRLKGSRFLPLVLPLAVQAGSLLFMVMIIADNIRNYDPANPLMNTGDGTLFERMHYVNKNYNRNLVRFINANGISGNAFSPWTWEGFLRRSCPDLKVYIGGRAQQIYSTETFERYLFLTGSRVVALQRTDPVQLLNSLGAQLIITPNKESSYNLILTAMSSGKWVILYADERDFLLVNTAQRAGAALVERFAAGQLDFPDLLSETSSRAAYYFSQPGEWGNVNLLELFDEAWIANPTWLWSYKMLFTNLQYDAELFGQVIWLLENQLSFLEELSLDEADAAELLRCRISLADMLAEIASELGQTSQADADYISWQQARELYAAVQKQWQQRIIK